MTGGAEFNEVYFTDVKVPATEILGRPGDGWRVSLTTLMNERTAIGGVDPARGSGPIASAVELWQALPAVARSDAVLDRLMRVWIEAEVIRLNNMRAANNRKMGVPGPEGSIGKLAGAENNKRVYEVCMDLLGAEGLLSGGYVDDERPQGGRTRSPAPSCAAAPTRSRVAHRRCCATSSVSVCSASRATSASTVRSPGTRCRGG